MKKAILLALLVIVVSVFLTVAYNVALQPRQWTFDYADGSKYAGPWKDGRFDHKAIPGPDGQRFEDEWWNDGTEGKGTLLYPDGRQYTGQWKFGEMHGLGAMEYPDGRKEEGLWRDGEFVGQLQSLFHLF